MRVALKSTDTEGYLRGNGVVNCGWGLKGEALFEFLYGMMV
jgi:hypothetical protein